MRSPFGETAGSLPSASFSGSATGQGRDPNALVHTLGKAGGVGIVAMHFEIAAADVDEGAAVGCPGDFGDLLAVVGGVVGKLAPLVGGRFGDPDVARAVLIEHPGNRSALGGGRQIRWKWSAHHLFEREARG